MGGRTPQSHVWSSDAVSLISTVTRGYTDNLVLPVLTIQSGWSGKKGK